MLLTENKNAVLHMLLRKKQLIFHSRGITALWKTYSHNYNSGERVVDEENKVLHGIRVMDTATHSSGLISALD